MKKFIQLLLIAATIFTINITPITDTLVYAQETEENAIYNTRATKKTIKVLAVAYNPAEIVSGVKKDIVSTYFGINLQGKTVEQYEDEFLEKSRQDITNATNRSYKFDIVKKLSIDQFIPNINGQTLSIELYKKCLFGTPQFDPTYCDNYKRNFDYKKFVETFKICETAKQYGVNEIWILSPGYFLAWEAAIIGPQSNKMFNINGKNTVISSCAKNYPIVNPTYDRQTGFLHSYGHRAEHTIFHFTKAWKSKQYTKHVERDMAGVLYTTNHGITTVTEKCGNVHYPHNTIKEYTYNSTAVVGNTCDRWHNFPTHKNAPTIVSDCQLWGCSESGWLMYWLKNVPSRSGQVAVVPDISGRKTLVSTNWWDYILNINKAAKQYTNPPLLQ